MVEASWKHSFKSISPKVRRLVGRPTKQKLRAPVDQDLGSKGELSNVDTGGSKQHQGPSVVPYYHHATVTKNQTGSKCFLCQELLHSKLADESIVKLKCGTLTHEQCIVQIIVTNHYNNYITKCYCCPTCSHLLLPKQKIELKSIMTFDEGSESKHDNTTHSDIFTKTTEKPLISNSNLSRLSATLKSNLPTISSPTPKKFAAISECFPQPLLDYSFSSSCSTSSSDSFVLTPSKILKPSETMYKLSSSSSNFEKDLPKLPLKSPQIDDLWLSTNSESNSTSGNTQERNYQNSDLTSLLKFHDSTYSLDSNVIFKSSQRIPSRTSSNTSLTTSKLANPRSMGSHNSSRCSISTIDSTAPQIHNYKYHSIDAVKNQFIRYLLENHKTFTYTQLIKVGTLRLIDNLSISFNNLFWIDSIVALFERYLVIFGETPVMMAMSHLKVELPVQSVLNLTSSETKTKVWLTSVTMKVIEKWVVAISDQNFNFPVKFISSTIELKNEIENRKRKLPQSFLKSTHLISSTLCGLNESQILFKDKTFEFKKFDNPSRAGQNYTSSSHQSLIASVSSEFDSDIDSDHELIQKTVQSKLEENGWRALIQNIDNQITS